MRANVREPLSLFLAPGLGGGGGSSGDCILAGCSCALVEGSALQQLFNPLRFVVPLSVIGAHSSKRTLYVNGPISR